MSIYVSHIKLLSIPFELEEFHTGSWWEAYINLAIAFDATLSDMPSDIIHLKEALLVLIDLDSDGVGIYAATRLLPKMDLLYRQARQHYSYNTERNVMVSKINRFTIEYFGDLTDFVNSLPWPGGCVPFYWAELSANDYGIDTSEWTVCIS